MVPGARACTLHVYFSQDNDIQPPVPFSNTPIASVPHEPATPSSTATVAIVVGVVAGVAVVVLVVCAAYAHRAQRAARRAAVAPPQDIDPPSARSSRRTIGASSRSLPGAMTGGGVGMMRSTRHLAEVSQNKKVGPESAAVVAVRPPPAAAPAPAPANLAVHAYTGPSAMATGGLPGRQAFVPYTPYGAVGYGPQPVPYAPYSNPYGGVGSGYGAYPGGGNAQLPPITVPVAAYVVSSTSCVGRCGGWLTWGLWLVVVRWRQTFNAGWENGSHGREHQGYAVAQCAWCASIWFLLPNMCCLRLYTFMQCTRK